MTTGKRQLKLGMFLRPAGHHIAAWRHPDAQADGGVNFPHYVEVAKTAERGLFDLLFSADAVTMMRHDMDGLTGMSYVAWIDPFTLLSGIAATTSHIGLVCTATTTYDEPFHIARRFASLDILSGGRAGWNVVTSSNSSEAVNFGREDHLAKPLRYKRAREFVEVAKGLWDSWDADAFLRNKDTGEFFDADKLHILDHVGEHFTVQGPLNVARSPQGQPVVVQAGASDDGRDLAAHSGEVIFTAHQTLDSAKAFYADVKGRLSKYDRHPDSMKIMPGFFVVSGESAQEAQDKFQYLQDLIPEKVGKSIVSKYLGVDVSSLDADAPVPDRPDDHSRTSRTAMVQGLAREEKLTIRQLWQRLAGGRGHYQIVGTPAQIADAMQQWFEEGGADGFNYLPPILPGSLGEFVNTIIPELQRRGIYRTAYEGKTLRENLGLENPVSRYDNTN